MLKTRKFLINNYPTWFFANKFFKFKVNDIFFTEDPYVYEKLIIDGFVVISPSDKTSERKESDESMSYKAAHFFKNTINNSKNPLDGNIRWGNVLNINMAYFINTVITRARELEYALCDDPIIVPYLSKDIENNLNSAVNSLTYIRRNYYGLLVQYMESVNYKLNVNLHKLPYSYHDFNSYKKTEVNHKKKFIYRFLSFISGDVNIVERLVFRNIRLGKLKIPKFFFNKKIYITGDNRMISSLIIPFIRRRIYPEYINFEKSHKEQILSRDCYKLPMSLREWSEENSVSDIQSLAMNFILFLLERHVNSLAMINNDVFNAIRDKNNGAIFLSNTPNSPYDSLLYENLQNNDKGKLISFTDGNSGINDGDLLLQTFAVRGLCNGFVAHSEYEEGLFKNITKNYQHLFYAYNFSKYQKPNFPVISKILSRKAIFKNSSFEKYLIYAPTRFKEDSRFIKGDFIDIEYWKFVKKVANILKATSSINSIIKVYGKEVFPGQMKSYVGVPDHPLSLGGFSDNVIVQSYPRLNYIIQSADIVLIDRATSTLQTSLISNKIVVFIHNKSHPISKELLPLLKKSIFVVDASLDGWEKELKVLICRTKLDLKRSWDDKRSDREILKKRYILGENYSKSKLIKWIVNL